MKKINKKGFVLAETLIVAVFVLSVFVMIYRNSIPIISEYDKLKKYDDINSVYAVNMIKQMIVKDASYSSFLLEVDSNDYKDISNCSNYTNKDLCNKTKEILGMDGSSRIIITKWDPNYLNDKIGAKQYLSEDGNRGIKDYISYIVGSYNKTEVCDYRIIISRKADGITKYANIGVNLYA